MKSAIFGQIESLIGDSCEITQDVEIRRWSKKVAAFLRVTLGEIQADEFMNLQSVSEWDTLAMRQGLLQGILAKRQDESVIEDAVMQMSIPAEPMRPSSGPGETRKVFVVHGHDEAAKETTARFLEKLGLLPIILHEQSSGGRTVIEKFEQYSKDVGFAVILLTPDDIGAAQSEPKKLQARARQNVVLELGYFMGRLTRGRVCALYKGGVELPSDIQGVIYVEMDNAGAWKAKLAQELVQARCPINLEGLVSG
jgi:predicted nucleotide-binding protein